LLGTDQFLLKTDHKLLEIFSINFFVATQKSIENTMFSMLFLCFLLPCYTVEC